MSPCGGPIMTILSEPNKRQRILTTALMLFNHQGSHQVSTNHIAKAMGISPGNLYYHFRNKGEINCWYYLHGKTSGETGNEA